MEAGKLELQYSSVSLKRLFEEVRVIFNEAMQKKGLEFKFEISEDLPSVLLMDEVRIHQILINLVGNAVKFTEHGYVHLSASCLFPKKSQSNLELTLKVEDSGIGIPKDQHQLIFESFQQITGQRVKRYGGTGLGLSLSKHLVEMMGGTLSVESEFKEGSAFVIVLPRVEVAAGDVKMEKDSQLDHADIVFEPATVLIADDIDYNREILKVYLEEFDFTFYETADGLQTLERISKQKPDLILLDMKMSGMDGYEVCRRLRKSEKVKAIPVIAISASALKDDETIIRKYCDGFLPKPVSKSQLIRELMKYLPFHKCEEEKKDKFTGSPVSQVTACSKAQLSILLDRLKNLPLLSQDEKTIASMSFNDIVRLGKEFNDMRAEFPQLDFVKWVQAFSHAASSLDSLKAEKLLLSLKELLPKIEQELKDN